MFLKCTFPHDGYLFGEYREVAEAEVARLLAADPVSRIHKWIVATDHASQLEAPVVEEPKPEALVVEEPKPEAPKPSKKK